MSGETLFQVNGLSVRVGERRLFEDFSLALTPGELVVLRGPSGIGKSFLLRALAGLDDPVTGQVLLRGQPAGAGGWPGYRRRVLLVRQDPEAGGGSLGDFLARPFGFRSSTGSFPVGRARELLARVGLEAERLEEPTRRLSRGELQRLALVRALLLEPSVLLLDEPVSALDPASVQRCEALIREDLEARGSAALWVDHAEARAGRLGARVVELSGEAT